SSADCTESFSTPLLDDLDSDGIPSCDGNCQTDPDDVAAACNTKLVDTNHDGVSDTLAEDDGVTPRTCGQRGNVTVREGEDCDPVMYDREPGNGRCDLEAGSYGKIMVWNGGRLSLDAGDTVACQVKALNATHITSAAHATLYITTPKDGVALIIKNSGD